MIKVIEKKEKVEAVVENCVMCGKPTPYFLSTPIGQRECFVEGAGQLCGDCYGDCYKGIY